MLGEGKTISVQATSVLFVPPDEPCPCRGCRTGGACYTRAESYRRALHSVDPEPRFAAHALKLTCEAVPASGGGWSFVDRVGETKGLIAFDTPAWEASPQATRRSYVHRYRHLDPFHPANGADPDLDVITISDLGRHEEFMQSRFAREFLARIGLPYRAMMYLRVNGRLAAQAWVARTTEQGDFGPDEVGLLRTLQSFLQVALDGQKIGTAVDDLDMPDALKRAGLSPREVEVAGLVSAGATNKEIARTLMISVSTVKSHIHRIFAKLDIRTRTELARRVDEVTSSDRAPLTST